MDIVTVTQEDRDLYKFILDAPFATCSRIDNMPDDAPELQAIARHRIAALSRRETDEGGDRDAILEEAAKVAEAHQPDRIKRGEKLARFNPEDREVIRAEENGEAIAARIIADSIRALKQDHRHE